MFSMPRIHILVDGDDKLRYEAEAARAGLSLGAWLREAAAEKYEASRDRRPFRDRAELNAFFARCDEAESGTEPDWDRHLAVMERSRLEGIGPP